MNHNSSYGCVNNSCHWTDYNAGYILGRMSTLAERLSAELKKRGWSQEDLADRCNAIKPDSITQVAIHKIATGKSKTTRKGEVIANALGVDTGWLLTGQGQRGGEAPSRSDAFFSRSQGKYESAPPHYQKAADKVLALPEQALKRLEPILDDLARLYDQG